jgi:hypothetical protein
MPWSQDYPKEEKNMQRSFRWTLLLALAVTAVAVCGSFAHASVTGTSISIAFARDEPNSAGGAMLDPATAAGAPGYQSKNWVNEMLGSGTDSSSVVRDDNGVATTTGATVTWSSNNTWASAQRGEENDNFDGGDTTGGNYTLMLGYLDTSSRHDGNFDVITVTGLPSDISSGYSVVIYALGGVRGRFASYSVNGGSPYAAVPGGDDNGVDNTHYNDDYHQIIGDDPSFGNDAYGNYMVFPGLNGDVTIRCEPRNFRGVINAIQIIKN